MKTYLPFLILLFFSQQLWAQVTDKPVRADVSLFTTVSDERYQSFWLVNNRWGMFDDSSANSLLRISASTEPDSTDRFDWGAGISVIGRASDHSTAWLQEVYLEAKLGNARLHAGRFKATDGHTNPYLSSGSLGISPNATPFPRVVVSIPDFRDIPFTGGWFEFKGHYGHGWLTDTRSVQGAMLHDKSFYLRTGGDTGVKFFTGLVHYVKWGGYSEFEGDMPQGFRDYLRIIVAREGDEEAPELEQVNALGDHLGFWDWGLTFPAAGRDFYLYYQHFYETNSGLKYRNLRDGLYGIEIGNLTRSGIVNNLVYEFLYTKHQTGPGLTDPGPGDSPPFCEEVNCGYRFNGRDDYYNHLIYRNGWTYHANVIGNPLFLTERQLNRVDPDIETYNNRTSIVGNRFLSHHIGFSGQVTSNLSYRALNTYIRHYGTYRGLNFGESWGSKNPENNPEDYFFNPPQHQWHHMLEITYTFSRSENMSIHSAVALDHGDLFTNAGILTGFTWRY